MEEYNAAQAAGPYGPPIPFNVSQGLITGCLACPPELNLKRPQQTNTKSCGGCKAVYYCSSEHQAADRPAHKAFCNRVKKALSAIEKDDADYTANRAANNYDVTPMEKYMETGSEYAYKTLGVNTKLAVNIALGATTAVLSMNFRDPLGMRSLVPWLYLRLGRDQECYDFCKWWLTTGNDMLYEWDDEADTPPWEKMKDEDPLESIEMFKPIRKKNSRFAPHPSDLSLVVAITLVKIRMLWGLDTLQYEAETFQDHVTSEVVEKHRPDLKKEEFEPLEKQLEYQVWDLYKSVEEMNKFFWPAMLEPGDNLTKQPNEWFTKMGSEAEMQKCLQECYNAWAETHEAFDYVKMSMKLTRQVNAGMS